MCVTLRVFTQGFTVDCFVMEVYGKKVFLGPRASVGPAVLNGPLPKAQELNQREV